VRKLFYACAWAVLGLSTIMASSRPAAQQLWAPSQTTVVSDGWHPWYAFHLLSFGVFIGIAGEPIPSLPWALSRQCGRKRFSTTECGSLSTPRPRSILSHSSTPRVRISMTIGT